MIGTDHPVSELSRQEGLQRLGNAEVAVRRALRTIERHAHAARKNSDYDVVELLSTAEHEAELALAELRGTRLEATGRRFRLSDLSRDEGLKRLAAAEAVAKRALQTIERQVHLARTDTDNDVREWLTTAEHEVGLVLAELRGTLQEIWDPVSLVTLYLSRANAPH